MITVTNKEEMIEAQARQAWLLLQVKEAYSKEECFLAAFTHCKGDDTWHCEAVTVFVTEESQFENNVFYKEPGWDNNQLIKNAVRIEPTVNLDELLTEEVQTDKAHK